MPIVPLVSVIGSQLPPPALVNAVTATYSSINGVIGLTVSISGGTAPYTYQWYRSFISNFAISPVYLLAGATSFTIPDVPILGNNLTQYYQCVVTDSSATPIVQVIPLAVQGIEVFTPYGPVIY